MSQGAPQQSVPLKKAFDPKDHLLQAIKKQDLSSDGYLFKASLSEARRVCFDRCLESNQSNALATSEKFCLKRCLESKLLVDISSLINIHYLHTLDTAFLDAEAKKQQHVHH